MQQHILNALATWRIMRIINREAAPYDIAGRFRDALGIKVTEKPPYQPYAPDGAGELAKAVACPYCLSVWIGWAVAFATGVKYPLLAGLAYSAVAVMLEKLDWRF